MSSPLLDRLRERRGLVYHADCSTDVGDTYGLNSPTFEDSVVTNRASMITAKCFHVQEIIVLRKKWRYSICDAG
jgi:hypothetical protein